MDNRVNLSRLAELLAQSGDMSKVASEQFIKNFFDLISQSVLSDGIVKIKGLGTFKLIDMENRESVNVNTGERFIIEGHQKISFVPDAELKEFINKPFAAFEPVELTQEQASELSNMDMQTVESTDDVLQQDEDGGEESFEIEPDNTLTDDVKVAVVKDVTQGRFAKFILRFSVWFLSIVLVLSVAAYTLWPYIGVYVLDYIAGNDDKQSVQYITEVKQDTTTVSPTIEPSLAPVTQVAPQAEVAPTEKPVVPAERVTQTEQKPQTVAIPAPTVSKHTIVRLNSQDDAKDLSEFTQADTLHYTMSGEQAVHVLKSGETITKLALEYYGSKKLWPYIVKYNNISNPEKLHAGVKIKIPVLTAK